MSSIKTKLTSRKFWLAVALLIVGILTLFKVDASITSQLNGVILSLGAVIAYIAGEGYVDGQKAADTASKAKAITIVPLVKVTDTAQPASSPTVKSTNAEATAAASPIPIPESVKSDVTL